jgi:hypothetical protein
MMEKKGVKDSYPYYQKITHMQMHSLSTIQFNDLPLRNHMQKILLLTWIFLAAFIGTNITSCTSKEVKSCYIKCKDASFVTGGESRCKKHCRESDGNCSASDGSGGSFQGCVSYGMTDSHDYCKHGFTGW